MNDWLKRQLYILIIAVVMLARSITLCALLGFSAAEMAIICIYAFCIMPSFNYVFDFLNRLTSDAGARFGLMMGAAFGFMAFVFPIVLAPAFMIINYCKVGKVIINKTKAKNRNKK